MLKPGLDLPTEEKPWAGPAGGDLDHHPWTLPANLAVSVNERLDYALAMQDGRLLLLAADLIESLSSTLERPLTRRATVKGALLAGLSYQHPLLERTSPVVIGGEYITTESGTGLVHTAPGHGVDDSRTGQKYGLPVLCPVDEAGSLTEEAGPFAGLNVLKDANPAIIVALEQAGALLKQEDFSHRYPYDWRTKKPTIFRATGNGSPPWTASGSRRSTRLSRWSGPCLRSQRIEAMVKERGDWCISRQRTWGVPIPVFYNRSNGEVLLNADTLAHIEALIAERN